MISGRVHVLAGLLLLAGAAMLRGEAFSPKDIRMSGKVIPEKVSFASGEKMTFRIEWQGTAIPSDCKYAVRWKRTGDDGREESGSVPVQQKELTLSTSMQQPGFVRIEAQLVDAAGKRVGPFFDGGAGVEIDKIDASPEPEDFDAFWRSQRAKLTQRPLRELERVKDASSTAVAVQYRVKISCPGAAPVTGYLSIPVGAKAASQKATVCFYGYGSKGQPPPSPVSDGIRFEINAHGFELGRDAAYYEEFTRRIKYKGKPYAFSKEQNANRETAYFNGMSLRVLRALEYVKSLPEWDGRNLTVAGGSQGALQAIWGAANDRDVTRAEIFIPWCCDLAGMERTVPRLGGWRPYWTPALEYFDPVHHAAKITCPVAITAAGLGDYTCPPSGVAALYNNLRCPKRILWVQGMQHGYRPRNPQTFELSSPAR